jgi:hypothetical protein
MATPRLKRIAFQGEPGANSHLAAQDAYPDMEAMPWAPATFKFVTSPGLHDPWRAGRKPY